MPTNDPARMLARRSFFSKLGFGLVGGAAVGTAGSPVQAQSSEGTRFQPVHHAQDDWYGQVPGKHRFIFDAPYPDGISSALQFINNYYNLNVSEAGRNDSGPAVILVARHPSRRVGYRDPVWAKYGKPIADRISL